MLRIDLKVNDKQLKRLKWMFSQGIFSLCGKLRHDVSRLGHDCYKLCLKRIIPVSHLKRPHLRDSFRVATKIIRGPAIHLRIWSDLWYSFYADVDASIPTRFPRRKKVMKWTTPTGEVVYARKAKGFHKRGLHFTYFAEIWLTEHFDRYVDMSLNRYLGI